MDKKEIERQLYWVRFAKKEVETDASSASFAIRDLPITKASRYHDLLWHLAKLHSGAVKNDVINIILEFEKELEKQLKEAEG